MDNIGLKDYFDLWMHEFDKRHSLRFDEMEKRVDLHFQLNDNAINKAATTIDSRLNSMNEFRDALKDQSGRMATREELMIVRDSVTSLQTTRANIEGRFAILSGTVSIAVTLVVWALSRFFGS